MERGRIASTVSAIKLNTVQYEFIYIDQCLQCRINHTKPLVDNQCRKCGPLLKIF